MNRIFLTLLAMTLLVGCSKGGAKSHLMEGATTEQEPAPTDTNLPELEPQP